MMLDLGKRCLIDSAEVAESEEESLGGGVRVARWLKSQLAWLDPSGGGGTRVALRFELVPSDWIRKRNFTEILDEFVH